MPPSPSHNDSQVAVGGPVSVRRDPAAALALRVVGIGSACGAVACAAWLLPASVHIVDWTSGPVQRIAYVAPFAAFCWAAACAMAAFVAILAIARRRGDRQLERAATLLMPLQLFWLWAVPFLPVLPDRLPLLLVLAGPVRWVVTAAIAVRLARKRLPAWHAPQVNRPTIFAVSLATYLVAALNWHAIVGLTGDEPHYLVITHSLLVDHDLDITNNHERGDYRAFFDGELKPDYMTRGRRGEIYGNHPPGLAALLIPAYAIAGAAGAIVFTAFIGALTAVAIFSIATRTAGAGVALLTWAAVCLTVPFVPHAWMLYPEIPGALIVAWTVLWLSHAPPDGSRVWIGRGVVLALLPWIHTRYATLLPPLAAFLALPLIRRPRRAALIAAFGMPIAISLTLWFWSFYMMYGTFDPQAPYGTYADTFVRTSNIPRGATGLVLDPKFGLLMFAPVYAFAIVGAVAMWRRRTERLFLAALVIALATYVAGATRLYIWWGGSSVGSRFLVPVLPLLTPFIALAAATLRRSMATLFRTAVIVGIVIAAFGIISPLRFLFGDPHGDSLMLAALQGNAPLAPVWPTWTEPPPWTPQLTRFAHALAGRFDAHTRADAVRAGREELLEQYDPDSLRAFDYARAERADPAIVARTAIIVGRDAGEINVDPLHIAGPFALPPGSFVVRIWFAGDRPLTAPTALRYHRGPALAASQAIVDGVATLRLKLPVSAPIIWVSVADADADRVERVEIQPEFIVPRSERLRLMPIAIEPLERPGSMLIYADRNSYPEGGVFWTRGTVPADVYVAPAGGEHMTMTLHVGPTTGAVHVRIGDDERVVSVPTNGTADLVVALPHGAVLVPVRVTAPASFTPAATDAHSTDKRNLGCQLRIQLN